MRKGNVLFLEDSDLIRGQSEFSLTNVASEARDQILISDLVIAGNKVIKNRYANAGIIVPEVGKKLGPIDKSDISNWEIAKSNSDSYESRINSRIDEVIGLVHEAFGEETGSYNWYFSDADEGEMGTINLPDSDEGCIYYYLQISQLKILEGSCKLTSNKLKTEIWDYKIGIPKKFLFMKNEDIISYVREEIKQCEKKVSRKKEKAKERAAEKKAAKEKALSKLSEQEKKLLGLAD